MALDFNLCSFSLPRAQMWSKHKKDILEMDVIVKYLIYDTDNNYGQLIAF